MTSWDARTGGGTATRLSSAFEALLLNYTDAQISGVSGGGYENALNHGISAGSASDQTTALATMYAALPAGTTVFFPKGTYIGKHAPGKTIKILGAGSSATVFQSPSSPGTNAIIVDFGTSTGCVIEALTIDAQGNANVARGVSSTGLTGQTGTVFRSLIVKNCTQGAASPTGGHLDPHGYGAAGIFNTFNGVVEDCEVIDCVYPIFMYYPDEATRVVGNKVWCSASRTNTNQGISFVRFSGETPANRYAGSLCEGNSVANAGYDPTGDGQNGNLIQVEYCRAVRVIGNTCRDAEAAGIHIAAHSTECVVQGNVVSGCGIDTAGGITIELYISEFTTIGTAGTYTGCVVQGNEVFLCSKYGIQLTWSAGSNCTGNVIHDNGWEAIQCDCDRCNISDNICFNNFTSNASPNPVSAPNVQAAIRVTVGTRCIITSNHVYDSLTTPVCDYSIAVNDSKHVITGNVCYQGFTTAAIFQTGSTTNQVANNIIT